jgi:hypothetical protein
MCCDITNLASSVQVVRVAALSPPPTPNHRFATSTVKLGGRALLGIVVGIAIAVGEAGASGEVAAHAEVCTPIRMAVAGNHKATANCRIRPAATLGGYSNCQQ